MVEKIKVAMSDRYVAENKALKLSSFHRDPKFLGESCYLPLHKNYLMKEISEIILTHIPNL